MSEKYFGKYTGIVEDNHDEQNLGQLKVSVPAISDDPLLNVRPALPYGFFFVPENNAKVWVEFEGGELGLPIWTGVQYVAGEWAAEAEANPPQKRVIKTASGHLIILDDQLDTQGIEIRSKTRIVIRCLGTIEIQAPNLIMNGRTVVPLPRPI
jgi:hypothetical protein